MIELAGQPIESPHHIDGIDFSGAQDASKKIWIAEGVVKGDSLLIEDCFRSRDLQDSGKGVMGTLVQNVLDFLALAVRR